MTGRAQRFNVEVPDDWRVLEDYEGTVVTLAEPAPSNGEQFAANVNVLWYSNEHGFDIPALLDRTAAKVSELLSDCVVLERSDEDARLLFTYRHDDLGLTADQRHVLDGNGYFVITATTTNARFSELSPTLAQIVDSFVVFAEVT